MLPKKKKNVKKKRTCFRFSAARVSLTLTPRSAELSPRDTSTSPVPPSRPSPLPRSPVFFFVLFFLKNKALLFSGSDMELERRARPFMSSKDVYPRLAVILWFRLEIARFTAFVGWVGDGLAAGLVGDGLVGVAGRAAEVLLLVDFGLRADLGVDLGA